MSRCIQTITGTITKHVEVYNLEVSNTKGNFVIPVNVTKVDRRDILSVVNPNYPELISRFQHLQGVWWKQTPNQSSSAPHIESTKTRIVYDASSKTGSQPSLNDCLNMGPPLQNQLFKVLVRGRFHPVALSGDIRKAFLQVRIRTEYRDVMRFHWLEDKDPNVFAF